MAANTFAQFSLLNQARHLWCKQILQKVLHFLTAQACHRQTDRQTDRQMGK